MTRKRKYPTLANRVHAWNRFRRLGTDGKSTQVQVLGKQLLITFRQQRHAHPYDFGTQDHSGSKSGSSSAINLNLGSISVARFRRNFAHSRFPICAS